MILLHGNLHTTGVSIMMGGRRRRRREVLHNG
jgi:hypothetical protein